MKAQRIFRLAAALLFILLFDMASHVWSAPQSSTVVFQPMHDAYVKSSTPVTSYGSAATLRVRKSSSETLTSYLKFEVTALDGFVQSAKLRLYVTDASSDGGAVYSVSNNYLGTTTPWLQSGLNWNNSPSISGATLSSTGAVSVGSWVEFEVASAIIGEGTYSFGLKNNASDVVYYSSKEGVNKPELVIEIETGPPPPPALTLTSPNGGESWTIGSTHTIQWSFMGIVANVALDFSTDAGATWSTISSDTPNDGAFDWTIPDVASNQCLVRISEAVDNDPVDVSDGVFSIVVSNTAGQVLPDLKIWINATTPISLYDAEIKVISGETRLRFSNTAVNVGAGALELFGIVNSDAQQPAYQRIYHDDGSYEDVLVGMFIFVGHEDHNHFHFQDFAIYRLRQITSGDGVGPIVATSDKISFCITDSDEYDETLPSAPTSHVYDCIKQGMSIGWGDRYGKTTEGQWIIIDGVADGNYWLESEANPDRLLFETRYDNNSDRIKISITKATKKVKILSQLLTLTEPNGGEKWKAGSKQTITWTSAGKISKVRLDYSTNGGSSWATIASSTTNDSSYNWDVPNAVSSNCLIRISDAADGNPVDVSDRVFEIKASASAASTSNENELIESEAALPDEFRLAQNYPNPFNPETRIEFDLPQTSAVSLIIYNVLGREVLRLVDEKKPAGRHGAVWDGRDENGLKVGSGIYFYSLQAGEFRASRKMLLVQ